MNYSIRFSHAYPKLKLFNGEYVDQAKLLEVLPIKIETLSKDFLDYDTGHGMYKFPEKNVAMNLLILIGQGGHLFTTIRPESSGDYYRGGIGQMFKILIWGMDKQQ